MANWQERLRILVGKTLELVGVDGRPQDQAPYRLSNDVQRVLAHLAATEGGKTALLEKVANGLKVEIYGSRDGIPVYLGSAGQVMTEPMGSEGKQFMTVCEGTLITTPVEAGINPDAAAVIVESVSDELSIAAHVPAVVEVQLLEGGTDATAEIGVRPTSGGDNTAEYELQKQQVVRFHTSLDYVYVVSTAVDARARVKVWTI